jgi:hypothetical protein
MAASTGDSTSRMMLGCGKTCIVCKEEIGTLAVDDRVNEKDDERVGPRVFELVSALRT